ncbi:uncharacterized protein LY79DRAFT_553052 [Colletotrichum navitas]|uniref:Uncharacterized protein n=1 Tax=Colletotrichum navitas TaxID=681940 RepID=A0AAD8V648_9PEZI|nr:uncharacterized protein LY79DRAFT_553052 [Colletotrichum navitas]KAK1593181.1 hypothetical protein LY79DRAFT_553052 [Colletotrichum navitas]
MYTFVLFEMQRINPPWRWLTKSVIATETFILRIRPDTRQPALSCSDPSPPVHLSSCIRTLP